MIKRFVLLLLLLPLISLADSGTSTVTRISWRDIGAHPDGLIHYIILGQLGLPLGQVASIEGVAPAGGLKYNPTTHLMVDTVDGKTLLEPCSVYLGDCSNIQPNQRYVLIGYDTGSFKGQPTDVGKYSTNGVPQTDFHFVAEFVVIKDISTNSVSARTKK